MKRTVILALVSMPLLMLSMSCAARPGSVRSESYSSRPSEREVSNCANVLTSVSGGDNYHQAKRACRHGSRYRPIK